LTARPNCALELDALAPLKLQGAQILAVELKKVERPQERPRLARAATQQVERGDAFGIGDDPPRRRSGTTASAAIAAATIAE
jgi:hypothetical protein